MAGAKRPLNDKQRAFAKEYLIDLNATQAAIRAGYSERTAGQIGYELLKKPEIQAEIEEGRKKAEERTEVTLDRVLKEYAAIAFSGMSRFVRIGADGTPRIDLSECTPADLNLLAEIQTDTINTGAEAPPIERVKIKMLDRLNALEKLGRHLGAFKEREQSPLEDALTALLKAVQGTALPIATPPTRGDDG